MNEEQTKNLLKNLKDINITLKTIGYESLFMINGIDVGQDKNVSEIKDCLVRINNLSQKTYNKIDKQISTINFFLHKDE